MKRKIKLLFGAFLLVSLTFISCDDDDDNDDGNPLPEITNVEAGNHDDGTNTIARGSTISVDFEAKTRSGAKLDYYHIEIHDHPTSGKIEDEYKIIDASFKDDAKFKGLLNAHVHKHVVVPDTANTGSYHVVIIVVDEEGNSSDTEELETHINIVE